MKFFSPQVCDTFDGYEPFREVYDTYRRHLESMRGILPERVLELAEPSGMEDGLVVRVDHDRERRILRLTLRVGHLQMGYSNLVLTYEGAEISPEHDAVFATLARSTHTQSYFGGDLAYHEVDAGEDGKIEHRLIFNANGWLHPTANGWFWFTIRCRTLHWRRDPRRSRRLPPIADRYPGGPSA